MYFNFNIVTIQKRVEQLCQMPNSGNMYERNCLDNHNITNKSSSQYPKQFCFEKLKERGQSFQFQHLHFRSSKLMHQPA